MSKKTWTEVQSETDAAFVNLLSRQERLRELLLAETKDLVLILHALDHTEERDEHLISELKRTLLEARSVADDLRFLRAKRNCIRSRAEMESPQTIDKKKPEHKTKHKRRPKPFGNKTS